jgi:hypothetical protein
VTNGFQCIAPLLQVKCSSTPTQSKRKSEQQLLEHGIAIPVGRAAFVHRPWNDSRVENAW